MRFFCYLPAVTKGLIRLLIFLKCLLEMRLGLLTLYFRSPKGSQKFFQAAALQSQPFNGGDLLTTRAREQGLGIEKIDGLSTSFGATEIWFSQEMQIAFTTKRGLSCQHHIHNLSCSYMYDASQSACQHHKAYTSLLKPVNYLLPDTSILKKTPVFRPCRFSVILL